MHDDDQEKMDCVAEFMEETFPDCGYVIIMCLENQMRYVGNMTRDDAEEVMEEVIDSFEADRLRGSNSLN